MKIEVMCLSGPIGSGKSTRAKYLESQGYVNLGFADAVRETAWMILGIRPKNQTEYDSWKDMNIHAIQAHALVADFTLRDMLIRIGEGSRNLHGTNFWAERTFAKIDALVLQGHTKFVISDARFLKSELMELMKRYETTFIFCNYKSDVYKLLPEVSSEKLACAMVAAGYTDGQLFYKYDIDNLINRGIE